MRRLRFLPERGLVSITSRTHQSRFLLPPTPEVTATIDGVIARAQKLYGADIHDYRVLSTHLHLLATFDDVLQQANTMCYIKGMIARKVGRLVGWRGVFWERRYSAIVVTDEEEAQVGRLRYLLENGCKEGLVWRPQDWPGACGVRGILDGSMRVKGMWLDLTAQGSARREGKNIAKSRFLEEETVELTQLPCWAHLDPAEYRQRIRQMVDNIADETAHRHAEAGTHPVGVKAMRRVGPEDRAVDPEQSPAPLVHAASKRARLSFRRRYSIFASAFLAASADLRRGLEAVFPDGCFPPGLPFVPLRAPPGFQPA